MQTTPLEKKLSGIIVPYRVIGVIFSSLAVLTVLAATLLVSQNFYGRFFAYLLYAVINAMLAVGFWKMKKWIVSILGITLISAVLMDAVRLAQKGLNVKSALIGLGIIVFLFVFSYLSRNSLEGEYKNYKILGVFVGLLVLAQIAITFLK